MHAVCARDTARKKIGFCTTARPKVARIETWESFERASVVERGNTLTGVKGVSEVVNRSLSREYVGMAGVDDGCVPAIWQKDSRLGSCGSGDGNWKLESTHILEARMPSTTMTPTRSLLLVSKEINSIRTKTTRTFQLLTSPCSGCATSWLSDMPCRLPCPSVGHTAARSRLDSRSMPKSGRMAAVDKKRSTTLGRK